jgi:hypothetical protein
MGLDLERVRMEVKKHVGSPLETRMIGNIPYTPRVKKVLALARSTLAVLRAWLRKQGDQSGKHGSGSF